MSRQTSAWVVFVGCVLCSIGANAFPIAPSSIVPLFVDQFSISKAAVGNIISVAIIGTVLAQLPGGYLLDRFDNRWLVGLSIALYVGVILVMQVVGSYPQFLGLRLLGGILAGFVFTAGANVIGEVFPSEQQGFATGLFLASAPAAFVLAHTTGPLIGTAFGPRRVFLLHAAIAVVGVALLWVGARQSIKSGGTPTAAEFARALGNRSVLLVSVSAFSMYALVLFLNTWVPTYGTEVLSLPLSTAGVVTALVPVAGIVGRSSGGWFSGRLGGRRRLVAGGGLALGLVLVLAVPFAEGFVLFLVLLGLGAFALQLGVGVYYVLARELAAVGTEGTSLTVMTTIGFAGSVVAPVAGGWLIGTYSWTIAFAVFAAIGVVGVVVLVPLPGETTTGTASSVELD